MKIIEKMVPYNFNNNNKNNYSCIFFAIIGAVLVHCIHGIS